MVLPLSCYGIAFVMLWYCICHVMVLQFVIILVLQLSLTVLQLTCYGIAIVINSIAIVIL